MAMDSSGQQTHSAILKDFDSEKKAVILSVVCGQEIFLQKYQQQKQEVYDKSRTFIGG